MLKKFLKNLSLSASLSNQYNYFQIYHIQTSSPSILPNHHLHEPRDAKKHQVFFSVSGICVTALRTDHSNQLVYANYTGKQGTLCSVLPSLSFSI